MAGSATRKALSETCWDAFCKRYRASVTQKAKFFLASDPKIHLLSHMANQLNDFFSAIADPTRRAVIERLVTGPASVSDLHAPHNMALPSFLKHVRKLEDAGLVRSRKSGRVRMLHIEAAPLAEAEGWLSQQRRLWEGRMDRLQALVENMERTQQ